jgi:hypothetical protein
MMRDERASQVSVIKKSSLCVSGIRSVFDRCPEKSNIKNFYDLKKSKLLMKNIFLNKLTIHFYELLPNNFPSLFSIRNGPKIENQV